MAGTSLGLIETKGYVAAIAAADAGVKAANVLFLGYRQTSPALITILFQGDVAAVSAAVHAAVVCAQKVGQVVATLIIPRPDGQLSLTLGTSPPLLPAQDHLPSPDQSTQPGPILNQEPSAEKPQPSEVQAQDDFEKILSTSVPVQPKGKRTTAGRKRPATLKRTRKQKKSTVAASIEISADAQKEADNTNKQADQREPLPMADEIN